MEGIFFEISAVIVVSTALALIAKWLKQPIILAFMLAGIILGPLGLDMIQSHELIDVMATFGIAFLLFLIGIELDISKFKELNKVALFSGFGQVLFTGFFSWIIALGLGFSLIESWFISIALTLSSTIIIVKILSEKRQMQSLYGRITIAILIIQDFLAVFALLLLESFGTNLSLTGIPWPDMLLLFVKTIFIAGLAFFLAKFVFRRIFKFIGHSPELLFLWSIAWCLLFGAIALSINFSIAIAVFFAGIALATLEYNFEIAARIRPLRDFFIVFFFAYVGSQLILSFNAQLIIATLILTLFVLIGNPLIVYTILRFGKHKQRTALFTGLAIGQISEFSFILANVGLEQGLIDHNVVSMIAIIGLVTMTVSTYAITYNEKIYAFAKPMLQKLRIHDKDEQGSHLPKELHKHIVVFGYHAPVNKILKALKHLKKDIIVVDYNPLSSEAIKNQDVYYLYGDMRDEDILERANVQDADMIISIVPYTETTLSLLQYIKHFKVKADVIVSADQLVDAERFYKEGATFVLHPESISLDYLKSILKKEKLANASHSHQEEIVHLLKDLGSPL